MGQNKPWGLSVIVPAHNESNGVKPVILSIEQVLSQSSIPFEIIVVDDGSTDGTAENVRTGHEIRLVRHEKREGYGSSLSSGLTSAVHPLVAIIDADGTYPAEEIPRLYEEARNGAMAVGWRKKIFWGGVHLPKSFLRRVLQMWASFLAFRFIPDLNSGLRVFDKNLWSENKDVFPRAFSFTTTLTLLCHFLGKKVVYVPIEYRPRIGKTKVRYVRDGVCVAWRMLKLTMKLKPQRLLLPLLFFAGLAMRLSGIDYGLPATFHTDEPHHINLAVYFGLGDLNPHVFKYPTLWMYFLSVVYGLFFLGWSCFTLAHSVREFSYMFVWDPTNFYLLARFSAALFGALGVVIYIAGRRLFNSRVGLIAAGLMAFSPDLVYYSSMAKPDMLMLFLASGGLVMSVLFYQTGRRRDSLLSGALLGLACSTQYTAGLLFPVFVWAGVIGGRERGEPWRRVLSPGVILPGLVIGFIAFFVGTPFALLDFQTFFSDLRDIFGYGAGPVNSVQGKVGFNVLFHFTSIAGWKLLGGILLGTGVVRAWRKFPYRTLFLLGPLVWGGLALGLQDKQAGIINYAFCLFPAAALLMACGADAMISIRGLPKGLAVLTLAGLLAVPFFEAVKKTDFLRKSDIRTDTKQWIESNIKPGTTILMDQVALSPPIYMELEQVEKLREKAKQLNHPREKYFELMMESHPGGGYRILRVQRTAEEMISLPRHGAWSQAPFDLLDVTNGLPALRTAGVATVVWTSWGAGPDNAPRLKRYFDDLETKLELIKEFRDSHWPDQWIRIYKVPGSDLSSP